MYIVVPDWYRKMTQAALESLRKTAPLDPRWDEQLLIQQRAEDETVRAAVVRQLKRATVALKKEHELTGKVLEGHFFQGKQISQLELLFDYKHARIYDFINDGKVRIAQILWKWEQELRDKQRSQMAMKLPDKPYDKYVGGTAFLDELRSLFLDPHGPHLVAVEGAGGIGKTSVAYELLLRMVESGEQEYIGWVSGQQVVFGLEGEEIATGYPGLTPETLIATLMEQLNIAPGAELDVNAATEALVAHLHRKPHLIVVDNLETAHDVNALLPLLKRLAHSSRFLLTTRKALIHDPAVRAQPMQTMELEDATALIHHYARPASGLASNERDIAEIFEVVGGNPLALRLVVGQCALHGLDHILACLRTATGKADNLYHYLFNAAWEGMSEAIRLVWLTMPYVRRSNGTVAEIAEICGQSEEAVRAALEHLQLLNLVDRVGSLRTPHYTIHNLTNSFLLAQAGRIPR